MKIIEPEAIHSQRGCVRYLEKFVFVAGKNRNNLTKAERIMWQKFLSKDKTGYRFLRQKPIHRFIVDFYCSKLNIAIEVDGSSHDSKRYIDRERDKFLQQIGIKTIRFTNDEVINNPQYIERVLKELPVLSKKGLGED